MAPKNDSPRAVSDDLLSVVDTAVRAGVEAGTRAALREVGGSSREHDDGSPQPERAGGARRKSNGRLTDIVFEACRDLFVDLYDAKQGHSSFTSRGVNEFLLGRYEDEHPWEVERVSGLLSRLKSRGLIRTVEEGRGQRGSRLTLTERVIDELIEEGRIDPDPAGGSIEDVVGG